MVNDERSLVELHPDSSSCLSKVEEASIQPSECPALVYLARLSPGSRRTVGHALDAMASWMSKGVHDLKSFPWHQLRYQHTQALRAALLAGQVLGAKGTATVNKYVCALRGALKEAWRLGYLGSEDYQRAVDLPSVKGTALPKGRCLAGEELQCLFQVCCEDETAQGQRDGAIVALLYVCGLRRSELVALDLADYEEATDALTVRRGKGNKARVVYVVSGARDYLRRWIESRGPWDGPLFCPVLKGGRIEPRGLSPKSVFDILRKRAKEAGIADFSPHDLRRTFIGDLLDAGADISSVQKLAGHANVSTTLRYDRRPEDAKRRAAALLRVPGI